MGIGLWLVLSPVAAFGTDVDVDGLEDEAEREIHGTDPNRPDSDGDRLLDGFEIVFALDPLDPDQDANGRIDGADDPDADGLANATEQHAKIDLRNPDSDGDGLLDGEELATGIFGPARWVAHLPSTRIYSVAPVDLDGDGDVDVVSGSGHGIQWHENVGGAGDFRSEQSIGTWRSVYIVRTADMDGDGDADVIAVVYPNDQVVWHENLAAASSFAAARSIASHDSDVLDLVTEDLDQDGDVDVMTLASNGSRVLRWYENLDGKGSFGTAQTIDSGWETGDDLAVADLDSDDDADALVFTSPRLSDAVISWLANEDGAGSFGTAQALTTGLGSSTFHYGFSVHDLDSDGDPDILTRSGSSVPGGASWYENLDGSASFGPRQVVTSKPTRYLLDVADLNADGFLDVVGTVPLENQVVWFENTNAEGGFAPPRTIATGLANLETPRTADMDSDGDSDVVAAFRGPYGSGQVAWFENLNVASPRLADTDGDGLIDSAEVLEYGTSAQEPDTDGDSLDDFSEVHHWKTDPLEPDTDGDGLLDGHEAYVHGTQPLQIDTDGDGLTDGFEIVLGSDPLRRTGEALRDPDDDALTNLAEQQHGTDPFDPDSDDDGLLDGAEVRVYGTSPTRSDTDGDRLRDAFEVAEGLQPLDSDQDGNGLLDHLDDFDADGLRNLAEQRAGTRPLVPDSDGDGLTDGEELATGRFAAPRYFDALELRGRLLPADIDGDGDEDVVTSGSGVGLFWYEHLTEAPSGWQRRLIDSRSYEASVADFDGDGDLDVTSRDQWFENMDGRGDFAAVRPLSGGGEILTGDLDGDGDVDLLRYPIESWHPPTISWLENTDGRGTFAPSQSIEPAGGVTNVFLADLDGDGAEGVVFQRILVNYVTISPQLYDHLYWLRSRADTPGIFERRQVSRRGTNDWTGRASGAADFDGDGDLDLLQGRLRGASYSDSALSWRENTDGAGSFGLLQDVSTEAETRIATSTADVDSDGDMDVVTRSERFSHSTPTHIFYEHRLKWYENSDGRGTFAHGHLISTDRGLGDYAFVDVDSDGDLDLLASWPNDSVLRWLENQNLADPLDPDTDDDGLLDGEDDCPQDPTPLCVPEPATVLLQLTALAVLAALRSGSGTRARGSTRS